MDFLGIPASGRNIVQLVVTSAVDLYILVFIRSIERFFRYCLCRSVSSGRSRCRFILRSVPLRRCRSSLAPQRHILLPGRIRHTIQPAAHLSALSCYALLNILQQAMPCSLIKVLQNGARILENPLRSFLVVGSANIPADLFPLRHYLADRKLPLARCLLRAAAVDALLGRYIIGSSIPFAHVLRRIVRIQCLCSRSFLALYRLLRFRRNVLLCGGHFRLCCTLCLAAGLLVLFCRRCGLRPAGCFFLFCRLRSQSLRRCRPSCRRRCLQAFQQLLCLLLVPVSRKITDNPAANVGCLLRFSLRTIQLCQLIVPTRRGLLSVELLQNCNLFLIRHRRYAVHFVLKHQPPRIPGLQCLVFLHQLQCTRQVVLEAVLPVQINGQLTQCIYDSRVIRLPLMGNGHHIPALFVITYGLIHLTHAAQRVGTLYVIPVDSVGNLSRLLKTSLTDQCINFIQAEFKFVLVQFSFLARPEGLTGLPLLKNGAVPLIFHTNTA